MGKSVVKKASTIDLAVEEAVKELGVSIEDVDVNVISKGGLLKKAEVEVTVKETILDKVEELVNNILQKMNLVSRATAKEVDDTFLVNIEGPDSGVAIGYRGEVLDAIQYLVLTFLNQEKYGYKKVVIDAEDYRAKRKAILENLANKLAQKAYRTHRKVSLEPMNPFERRIIHTALANSDIAETVSEGEDLKRHIVIIPKGVDIIEDRPRKNRKNYHHDEVDDGEVHKGFYSIDKFEDEPVKTGAPKFKSFGGPKRF